MMSLKEAQVELDEVIEQLYSEFKSYSRRRGPVTGCPHCVTEDDGALLESRPLRDLTWKELDYYSGHALTTFGTLEDFKRFLPRILELVASHSPPSHDLAVVVGKIGYARREPHESTAFQKREFLAIEKFLMAWWHRELFRLPSGHDQYGSAVLQSIGCVVDDIRPYLTIWESADGVIPAVRLAITINDQMEALYKHRTVGMAYWDEGSPCRIQLTEWLASQPPRAMLEKAVFSGEAGQFEADLSTALSVLESLINS